MTLAGMENGEASVAPRREQPSVRFDGAAQLRNVVAEHFAKAPGLEKIALHVDDEQRAMLRREREGVGFGREVYRFIHAPRRVKGRRQSESVTARPKISGPSGRPCGARKEHACRLAVARSSGKGGHPRDCFGEAFGSYGDRLLEWLILPDKPTSPSWPGLTRPSTCRRRQFHEISNYLMALSNLRRLCRTVRDGRVKPAVSGSLRRRSTANAIRAGPLLLSVTIVFERSNPPVVMPLPPSPNSVINNRCFYRSYPSN